MAMTVENPMDLLGHSPGFTLANATGTIATVSPWLAQNMPPGRPQGYCVWAIGWNLRKHNPYFIMGQSWINVGSSIFHVNLIFNIMPSGKLTVGPWSYHHFWMETSLTKPRWLPGSMLIYKRVFYGSIVNVPMWFLILKGFWKTFFE